MIKEILEHKEINVDLKQTYLHLGAKSVLIVRDMYPTTNVCHY